MNLYILRDQAKGIFEGGKFELSARIVLTNEEAELIRKYKADKKVLLKKEIKISSTGRTILLNLTIGQLMAGQTFKCNNIAEILEYEANVKESYHVF